MRMLLILSLGICLFSTTPASADSVLGDCSLNGVSLSADVLVGYEGIGSTLAADFVPFSDSSLPVVPATPSGTASAPASAAPAGGGNPKDKVEGTLTASFELGIPFGTPFQDTLLLNAQGFGSALNSFNSAFNPADATVNAGVPTPGGARAEFFIDIVPGMDCDTFLNMPEMRLLEPFETFLEIKVIFDPGLPTQMTLATLTPGSPAATVLLPEDHSYLIELKYVYRVPFGFDPAFDFSYAITVGASPAVPGLGMEGAIMLGLLLLGTVALAARRSWTRSPRTS